MKIYEMLVTICADRVQSYFDSVHRLNNGIGRFSLLKKSFIYISLLVSLMLVAPIVQASTSYALIVGVSKYHSLPDSMQLTGPKYDAEMVRDFLASKSMQHIRTFAKDHVTVLADGVDGAKRPTHDAILTAMDAIAAKAKPGDFAYLHFSGHGSRQPAKLDDTSETDGLDELFLPADIGHWDNDIGSVDHALVDDEIGQKIMAIRNKGAFVWAVFDSCHSGTMTRGAPVGKDVKMRKVPASVLGIPQRAMDAAEARASKSRGLGGRREGALDGTQPDVTKKTGGFVAFYAAQTTQTTPEMKLPANLNAGDPNKQPHGLFSFMLLQVISEHPGITYRQAGQEILQRYSASNVDHPTPLFEGDLDARVFGSEAVGSVPHQWPVAVKNGEWHIPAGHLNRLARGSVVAILASPVDSLDKVLAYAEVVEPGSMDSLLKPVAYKGKKADALKQMPDHAYARLVLLKQDFSIKVALPEKTAVNGKDYSVIKSALDHLDPDSDTGLRVNWVQPGDVADIRLAVDVQQLWFLPSTGEMIQTGENKTPSIKLKGKDAGALKAAVISNLASIARAVNLLRVSEGMGAATSQAEAYLTVKRKAGGEEEKITGDMVPAMFPGDIVYLTAKNRSTKPMDLNILFIGSDFSITPIFKGRIHPGDSLKKKGLFRVTDTSFGSERLLVIANEAKPQSMVLDLSFLQQRALPKTRGRGLPGLSSVLRDAGFGATKTRGVEPFGESESSGAASILQFKMDTRPAPVAISN